MAYPEHMIAPMRQDLTRFGVEEARTPEQVDRILGPDSGMVLMVVNSVCGCAAGRARPAVGMALQHKVLPDNTATVFAAGDDEAVAHLRTKQLGQFPPSSPCMALFENGKPVYMLHRSDIERRDPMEIAKLLVQAFDEFCAPKQNS